MGDAWFFGTPRGGREFQQLYEYEVQGKKGWKSFRLATSTNPIIDPQELADAKAELPPAIYAQEYEGVPAPDGGNPFGLDAIAACFRADAIPGEVVQWGIDLAKSQDWSVAIGLDNAGNQVAMHRWQGIPWSETIERLKGIVGNTFALADSTGVGDPIVEQMRKDCPNLEGFLFSASSKQKIMEGLAVALQSRKIAFHDPILRSELDMFGYEYTRSGCRYSAPSGLHDDCVCALALANYGLSMRPRPLVFVGDDNTRASIDRRQGESVYEHRRRVFVDNDDDE